MDDPSIGSDMMADRPLLVVHDGEEGHLVYDLVLLQEDDDDAPVVTCSPRPVAQFPVPLWFCPFAVAGGRVVAALYEWLEALFHDTVMKVGGYDFWERHGRPAWKDADGRPIRWWPMLRRYAASRRLGANHRDAPAMLPLLLPGDAAAVIIRMDTILFDGIYSFDKLRPLPGGAGCSWDVAPLPSPPVGRLAENQIEFVTAYCAVGTRVWISVTRKGNFSLGPPLTISLDVAQEGGAWRAEGAWQLPFQGRGLHVPELGSVVGLTADDKGFLCACDVLATGTGAPPVVRHVWPETFPRPWEECVMSSEQGVSRPRDLASLAYLGNGRFCICRPMSTSEPTKYDPPITFDACCFLVLELKRVRVALATGTGEELQLVKRGKMSYMWPPHGRQSPYMGFIQPAT